MPLFESMEPLGSVMRTSVAPCPIGLPTSKLAEDIVPEVSAVITVSLSATMTTGRRSSDVMLFKSPAFLTETSRARSSAPASLGVCAGSFFLMLKYQRPKSPRSIIARMSVVLVRIIGNCIQMSNPSIFLEKEGDVKDCEIFGMLRL